MLMLTKHENPTIRMLGYQFITNLANDPDFAALYAHERHEQAYVIAIDAYNLGKIHGIRQERARRKGKIEN